MREFQRKMELHSTWAKVLEKVSISPSLLLRQRRKTSLPAAGSVPQQCERAGGQRAWVIALLGLRKPSPPQRPPQPHKHTQ